MTAEEHSGAGRGTLLLADISGYTAFLQAVAAAHAADMAAGRFVPKANPLLTSLLDGIVGRIAPPFVLSKLEGDAVFAFAAEGELDVCGQSVVDCPTACYGAYRARRWTPWHANRPQGQAAEPTKSAMHDLAGRGRLRCRVGWWTRLRLGVGHASTVRPDPSTLGAVGE